MKQATIAGKQAVTRTVTESEMAQLLKKQQQLQQRLSAAVVSAGSGGAATTSIQSLSPQVFAQAIQAGTSGTQVATLVKTVSSAGGKDSVKFCFILGAFESRLYSF